ncbi:uncharacterized protein BJ171DRAFT_21604 [Polychytrium aggregatum]|uniref:uncharacterized protein n=1 Tax=Polychytrium aggregatum TaxID=110093 RepID=UPI0022FF4248|nr:uncharacterized protein BJ171DRAFT_21604 [Polychytrium aggregatum]KAI9193011.1 hypothetical protein BJ171DRAFT_21604 [Polychytrium aggregatum]
MSQYPTMNPSSLKSLVENASIEQQYYVFGILKEANVPLSFNDNGVILNLSAVPAEVLQRIAAYIASDGNTTDSMEIDNVTGDVVDTSNDMSVDDDEGPRTRESASDPGDHTRDADHAINWKKQENPAFAVIRRHIRAGGRTAARTLTAEYVGSLKDHLRLCGFGFTE